MKKIIKSYLKTFFKNWLSTIFIVIFIMTLSTSVIGMLSTPLQIYTKMLSAQKVNKNYDSIYSSNKGNLTYSDDFVYEYIYKKDILDETFKDIIDLKISDGKNETSNNNKEIAKIVNYAFARYRLGSTNVAYSVSLSKKADIDIENWKKAAIQTHIKKSILEGYLEFQKSESNFSSSVFGTLYRIYYFFISNNIPLNINQESLKSIKNKDTLKNFIKITYDMNTQNFSEWKPTKINFLAYTIFNNPTQQQLSNSKYQHDDRIYLFEKIFENNSDYNLKFSKNFSVSSSNPLQKSLSYDIRSDANQEMNNILFENNSNNTLPKEWENNSKPEIVVSSAYASKNKLKVNDKLILPIFSNSNVILQEINKLNSDLLPIENIFMSSLEVNISGIGQTYDDFVPGTSYSAFTQKMDSYAILYFSNKFIEEYRDFSWKYTNNNESKYALDIRIKRNNDTVDQIPYNLFTLRGNKEDIKIFTNLEENLIKWSKTNVASSFSNLEIRIIVYIVLGILIMTLSFIFINFQLKKEINETRKQLGIFKSFGYKKSELSWVFSLKTFILFFISLFLGFFVSFPMQTFAAKGFETTVTIAFSVIYLNPLFILTLIIGVPILFTLIGYLSTLTFLNESVLSLMNNSRKVKSKIKQSFLFSKVFKGQTFFNWRLRRAFVKSNKGKFYMIQFLFAFASLAYILLFGAQTIMTTTINQAFETYNKKLDHSYNWWSTAPDINVTKKGGKLDYTKEQKMRNPDIKYFDYSEYKNSSEYVDNNKEEDIRFRIETLIQMTNNYYKTLSIEEKLSFILPYDEVIFTLENIFGNKITSTSNEKQEYIIDVLMKYNLNSKSKDFEQGLSEVKTTGKTAKIIDIKNEDDFNDPKLSMSTLNSEKSKNIFLSSFSSIYSIKNSQGILISSVLPTIYGKPKGKINKEDLIRKITNENVEQAYKELEISSILNDIDITSEKQNSFYQNELLNHLDLIFDGYNRSEQNLLIEQIIKQGINNISSTAKNLYDTAIISNNYGNRKNQLVNFNEVYLDTKNETLTYNMALRKKSVYDDARIDIVLLSNQFDKYGNPYNSFNFSGVSTEQMNRMFYSTEDNEKLGTPDTINVIIPYFMAKEENYKIGDIINASSYGTLNREIKFRVVGINQSQTLKTGTSDYIWVNYESFENLHFSDKLKNSHLSSNLFSNKKMLDGKISLKDFTNSYKSIKFVGENLFVSISEKENIFKYFIKDLFRYNIDPSEENQLTPMIMTNPNLLSSYYWSSSVPMNITKLVVDEATKLINQIMLIFVLLTTVLLSIIVVVVIGIIVEEAKITILTMQALGYKPKEINWIIMGSYIIGALVSFVIAYILSVIIWKVVLAIVAEKFSVYIFMSFDWKSILITFTVMSIVMFFGWFASNKQVKRNPLTQITNLA